MGITFICYRTSIAACCCRHCWRQAQHSVRLTCRGTQPCSPSTLTPTCLFAASNDASTVTSIDPDNCHINHVFQLNKPIYGLGVAAVGTSLSANSGNQLWVSDSTDLTVFDDIKGTQIHQIPIPEGPRYISIPPEQPFM